MNKIYRFIIGNFLVAVIYLSLATVQAQALDPRCDSDIWDIQNTYSQAMLIRDTALAAEMLPQNDSTLAMTCFDQAMVTSARAGRIFSDQVTPPTFASLTSIATGLGSVSGVMSMLGGASAGSRGSTLMADLNDTISDVLGGLLDDFMGAITGAISSAIGSLLSTTFGAFLGSLFTFAVNIFLTLMDSFTFNCDNMANTWRNSIIGQSVASATAFIDNDVLFDYAEFGTAITGITSNFQDKLDNFGNDVILDKAWDDLNNRLVPGGITVYKTPPAIGVNSTLATVLGAM